MQIREGLPEESRDGISSGALRRLSRHHDDDADRTRLHALEHMRWRKQVGLSRLKVCHVAKSLSQQWLVNSRSRDAEGRPILIMHFGNYQPSEMTGQEALLMFLYVAERVLEDAAVTEVCIFQDFSGWSMKQRNDSTMRLVLETLRDQYPGILGPIYVVDPPWYLTLLWNVVRRFTHNAIVSRIKFTKRSKLTKYVSAERLPASLGGTFDEDVEGWLRERAEAEHCSLGTDADGDAAPFTLDRTALRALHIAQITLANLESTLVCRGTLNRRGTGGIMESLRWHERFFVLDSDATLFHFDGPNDKGDAGGRYELRHAHILDEGDPGKAHSFTVRLPTRTIFLAAVSDQGKREWLAQCRRVVADLVGAEDDERQCAIAEVGTAV